jgi:hypothetical protein
MTMRSQREIIDEEMIERLPFPAFRWAASMSTPRE